MDHGGHQGNVARAIAECQWRDIVDSQEATNAFHWAMHIEPYCPGGMAIEIVTDLPFIFCLVDFVVGHNHKLKTTL
jgi:hypothetical protein